MPPSTVIIHKISPEAKPRPSRVLIVTDINIFILNRPPETHYSAATISTPLRIVLPFLDFSWIFNEPSIFIFSNFLVMVLIRPGADLAGSKFLATVRLFSAMSNCLFPVSL